MTQSEIVSRLSRLIDSPSSDVLYTGTVTVEAEPLLVYADSLVIEYEEACYIPEYL